MKYFSCNRIKYNIVIVLFLFSSCRKLVQDEFPDYPNIPVVNGILATDSIIRVHVSLSDKIGANEISGIDNAEVYLYIDGELNELMAPTQGGIYESSMNVIPGHEYHFEVDIAGCNPVSASTYIPLPPVIADILHTSIAGKDDEGFPYSAVTFTFHDNPEEDDFYQAVIAYGGSADEFLYITDQVLLNEGLPLTIFSDELIENGQYTMVLNFRNENSRTISDQPGFNYSPIQLELQAISYEYYQYLKHLYLYETGRYPSIVGGVVNAFQLYTNVENGFGIVAGYSSTHSDTLYSEPLSKINGNELE